MNATGAATPHVHSGWNAAGSAVSDTSRPASPPASRRWEPGRRRGLLPTWLLSAVIHAGLIVVWLNQAGPPVARQVPRMEVRIVPFIVPPPPARLDAATQARRVQPPQSRTAELSTLRPPAARSPQPAAITPSGKLKPPDARPSALPSPSTEGTAEPQPGPSPTLQNPQDPTAPPAPSSGKSGLRLDRVPPFTPLRQAPPAPAPSVREQALNDARSNTHRPSAEARMAQGVGDDRLQEEALGDGRRRFRQGGACADVHRTHIAQLNPFDARLRDLNVAKPCE